MAKRTRRGPARDGNERRGRPNVAPVGDEAETQLKHDPYGALREANYRWFIGGWVVASMGLQMQGTALAWEVYERTGQVESLGWVSVARALPVLLFALPAGQLVDRLDRRKVLIATQVAFAIASVFLTIGSFEHAPMGVLYLLVALTGCARVFNGPSRSSLLPVIVSPEQFHNAVTWNSGVFQLSATLGPLLAGVLIVWTKAAWPVYAIAGASCVWFAFAARYIRARELDACPMEPSDRRESIWQAVMPSRMLPGILQGVRHVWMEKTVLGVLALDLFAVLLGGSTALLPVYAKDILHVGPVGLGALKAAPYVGALLMALWLAHRPPMENAGRSLLLSVAGFGVCTIVFGLSTWFWLSLLMLATLGALDNVSVVVRHVLVSVRTPDRLRGRVSAVNSVFIESSNELGGLESAQVAKYFGPVASVVSGGIGTIAVVLLLAWRLPELRRLKRLSMVDEGKEVA